MMCSLSLIFVRLSLKTTVNKQRIWHLLSNYSCSNHSSLPHNSLRSYSHNNLHPPTSYLEQAIRSTSSLSAHRLNSMHSLPTVLAPVDVPTRVRNTTIRVIKPSLLDLHLCSSLEKGKHTRDEMRNIKCLVDQNNLIIKK